jgi:uridine phosphorylase
MIWRNSILAALTICVASDISIAFAQTPARVGEAAVVKNEVIRVSGSGGTQINVGDAVVRNETVRTGAKQGEKGGESETTSVTMRTNSSLTLDKTVFSG